MQYLYTTYRNDAARVTASQGTAPAPIPFIPANAAGTDFARSDANFRMRSLTLTGPFRF